MTKLIKCKTDKVATSSTIRSRKKKNICGMFEKLVVDTLVMSLLLESLRRTLTSSGGLLSPSSRHRG
jgi:hypothetical protein